MASDAAPIRTGHVDSTVQQVPPQAYPEFRSSKGATSVSSFCSFTRFLSAVASAVVTVILVVVLVVVLRRASNGKQPASPKARAPSGPGPVVCEPPPTTRPGVTILDQMLSASSVQDPAAQSKAKSWSNITVLPPPTTSSDSSDHTDIILLRFAESFDPVLQATLRRIQAAVRGRRLLASNVTQQDLFGTVQRLNATNGFMAPAMLGTMLSSTHRTLAKLPRMLTKWYYSSFTRTMILHAKPEFKEVARKLLDSLPAAQLDFLEHAKPIFKTASANLRPNDPNFAYQWALPKIGVVPASGSTTPTGETPAWSLTEGSDTIVVAVLDSGVDYRHPDLADSIWTNPGEIPDNNVDDDGNGFVDDYHGFDFVNGDSDPMDDDGHGSHCAGIIAAQVSNREGIAGVAPKVKVVALKVLDAQGNGRTDMQLLANDYVMSMGVHITSNSYGGDSSDPALEDSLQKLADRGILFVAAAGNEHRDTDVVPSYPASSDHPNIISVAASNENDCFTNFTNYGSKTVHLAAPGQLIISTVPTALYSDGYLLMSGTSQAAPHVAAVAALVLSEMVAQGETATGQAEKLKQVILESATPVPAFKGFLASGGRLDAAKAVAAVQAAGAGRRRLRESRRQLRHE